jgi:hypothetical protein
MDQPKKHDIRLDPRFSNKKLREYYRLLLVLPFIVATVIADFLKTRQPLTCRKWGCILNP